jgi:hypothetical protein
MDTFEGFLVPDGAAFTEGLAWIFIVAQLASLALVSFLLLGAAHAYLFGTVRRRRCFRCPLTRRDVEVEFLEHWILGVRRATRPHACSAFDVPTALECGRRCADPSFRIQWESPWAATRSRRA